MRGCSILCACWLAGTAAFAATFHLDPASGSLTNRGDAEQPWPGLEAVIRAGFIRAHDRAGRPLNPAGRAGAGDRLLLRGGYHGEAILDGYYLDAPLEVAAEEGQTPRLQRILLRGGSRWVFRRLEVSPVHGGGPARGPIVAVLNHTHHGPADHVVVEQCRVFSVPDCSGWSTTNDWLERAVDGITLEGDHCRAVSNEVRNVAWGIQLGGVSNYAGYNLVENFRGDGLRTVNHFVVAEYNTIRNAFLVDGNHMDGIQGFYRGAPGREVRGVVIRGNVIHRHLRPDAPWASPYLQGIGFFDGPFVDCVFEDNRVVADSYHGLSVYNALRCLIRGNLIEDDPGTNMVGEARIVLGCKPAIGREVRGNRIISNRCDRLVIAPEAVDTVLDGNVERRAR
jgi:hypothetical protein